MKVPAFANPTLDWRCLTEREMEQLPRSTARRAGRARARALRRRPRRSPSSQLADREQEEHQLGDAHAHATATSPPPSHHTRRQRRWRRRPPPPRGVGTDDQQGDEAEQNMQTPTGQTYASSLRKRSTAASTPTASWPPRWRWDRHGERTSVTTQNPPQIRERRIEVGSERGRGSRAEQARTPPRVPRGCSRGRCRA